ncbi:hypothetical protein HMN09_00303000 [Mycena chlorophos]|uniref:LysM domain-containing protein n=1 Tax=Mycena chlorophos TaxID=658473 RepID=A0A8H6TLV0_MYCCL|nr:hypothetical protein HMN09_00303000 [Mycena chlorophos]
MFSKLFVAFVLSAIAVSATPLEPRQSCSETYTVVSGDTCAEIEAKEGISDATLHSLNPSINSGCTSTDFFSVSKHCTGGSTGGSCGNTYTVVSGDTCAAIEAKEGISDATLHQLNPSINSGCTNLQIGEVLCLGGGGSGTGGETFTGRATYYGPGGALGACGTPIQNSDFVVALGEDTWDGGAHCGEAVSVTYQGTTIQVTALDLCPGCQGPDGIDLVVAPMAALDPNYVNDGVITVTWGFE